MFSFHLKLLAESGGTSSGVAGERCARVGGIVQGIEEKAAPGAARLLALGAFLGQNNF